MYVLNLETAPCRPHADEHPAINWKIRSASMGAAVRASDNDPFPLGHGVHSRELASGKLVLHSEKPTVRG